MHRSADWAAQLKGLVRLQVDSMPDDLFSQIAALAGRLDSYEPSAFGLGLLAHLGHGPAHRRCTVGALALANVNPQPLRWIRRPGCKAGLGAGQTVPTLAAAMRAICKPTGLAVALGGGSGGSGHQKPPVLASRASAWVQGSSSDCRWAASQPTANQACGSCATSAWQ